MCLCRSFSSVIKSLLVCIVPLSFYECVGWMALGMGHTHNKQNIMCPLILADTKTGSVKNSGGQASVICRPFSWIGDIALIEI